MAGVQGNGQREMVEAITGLRHSDSGSAMLLGENVVNTPPRNITALGTAHIPEDRQRHGLVLSYSIADNLILADYYQSPFSRGSILNEADIDSNAQALVDIRVRCANTEH